MTHNISACIITLNEEEDIERCIDSLFFAGEILVVDSGSTDNTVKLVKKYKNTRILVRPFDNFIAQKNFALQNVCGNWIISLDADEVIPGELAEEIQAAVKSGSDINGYFIPRKTEYMGKWIHHGGWYPNYQMRLIRNGNGIFTGDLVHEQVAITGRTGKLKNPILHYSYKNITDHINNINRYTELSAREKFGKGKCYGVTLAWLEGLWKFVSMYIFRLGFLDGKPGFVLAVFGFFYNFLKYIKVYEMCKKRGK